MLLDDYKKNQAKTISDIDILNYDLKFNIEEGDKIAKITLSGLPKNIKYVYLSIKGETYDFMKVDDSVYELSLLKEVLEEKQKYEIYYMTNKGEVYRF
ncbi:SpoIIIJ-associated protein [Fusobacterium animalis ATCC 51191]|uniref:SpoIIIJ-associated protein n=2 Tax=Fusobacterium animalis TaxID=76859 RepID=F9ER49_9FUSO|nr:SpoIIIJ-associated protein [Fusobacterium animalis ATCC 51191]